MFHSGAVSLATVTGAPLAFTSLVLVLPIVELQANVEAV